MNNSRQFLALARLYQSQIRNASAGVKEVAAPRFNKLKEVQKKFGVDDGIPVYLKSGFGDRMLYLTTFGLTLVGVALSLETFVKITFGKSS